MTVLIKDLGVTNYSVVWHSMQDFTKNRCTEDLDQIWFTQHNSVYTQGLAGKDHHVLFENDIPIVRTDRGGQITYHGLGQIIIYVLLDLQKKSYSVRGLVDILEGVVISYLSDLGVVGVRQKGAPGVYVGSGKIASVGLRVSRGCSFHGLAFNVSMDLKPFSAINPCGYKGLTMVNLSDFVPDIDCLDVMYALRRYLVNVI